MVNTDNRDRIAAMLAFSRTEYVNWTIRHANFEYPQGMFYGKVGQQVWTRFNWMGSPRTFFEILAGSGRTFVYVYSTPRIKRTTDPVPKVRAVLNEVFGVSAVDGKRLSLAGQDMLKEVHLAAQSSTLIGLFDAEFNCCDAVTGEPIERVEWGRSVAKFLENSPDKLDRMDDELPVGLRKRLREGAVVDEALVGQFGALGKEIRRDMRERIRIACRDAEWPCEL